MKKLTNLAKISSLTLLGLSIMLSGCCKPSEKEAKPDTAAVEPAGE